MEKMKEFKLASTHNFQVKEADNGTGIYIEGYASTPVVDRDEEIIPVYSINTMAWEKNPILLYMHNRDKPIGKIVAFEKRQEGFWVKAFISQAVEKTMGIITLIKDEVLRAFSIGFRIKDYFINAEGRLVYKDIELLEVSVVSIPANTDAIFNFVKSLKEQSQKSENPVNNKKGEIGMDETKKLQEMEETLKRIMEEKEAAEKALKEKEDAEKRAKEETEKAQLKNDVKAAKETVEKFATEVKEIVEGIKTLKDEIKALKEEVEVVKESKPKIEVKAADERTVSKFMDSYKDALIESKLFGRKFTETKVFSKLPEQAKAMTIDTQFQTMVHNQILDDIKQKAPLFNLFAKMGSDAQSDVYPFAGTVTASWGSLESIPDYNFNSKIQFDYYKVMAGVEYKYEDEDNTIISWLPKVRMDIVEALAEAVDDAIINGGIAPLTTNVYKGLLAYANDNPTETLYPITDGTTDTSTVLTAADLRGARTLMKKYGVQPRDVVIVLNSLKYLQLLGDKDELVTVDKAGSLATLITGSVGLVNGSNVIVNDSFPGSDVALDTAYSALIFNKNMFAVKAKSVLVEIDKNIQTQNRMIVGSMNVSFIPLVPLTSGALDSQYPIVVAVNNA